jgi:hypothetical protein
MLLSIRAFLSSPRPRGGSIPLWALALVRFVTLIYIAILN